METAQQQYDSIEQFQTTETISTTERRVVTETYEVIETYKSDEYTEAAVENLVRKDVATGEDSEKKAVHSLNEAIPNEGNGAASSRKSKSGNVSNGNPKYEDATEKKRLEAMSLVQKLRAEREMREKARLEKLKNLNKQKYHSIEDPLDIKNMKQDRTLAPVSQKVSALPRPSTVPLPKSSLNRPRVSTAPNHVTKAVKNTANNARKPSLDEKETKKTVEKITAPKSNFTVPKAINMTKNNFNANGDKIQRQSVINTHRGSLLPVQKATKKVDTSNDLKNKVTASKEVNAYKLVKPKINTGLKAAGEVATDTGNEVVDSGITTVSPRKNEIIANVNPVIYNIQKMVADNISHLVNGRKVTDANNRPAKILDNKSTKKSIQGNETNLLKKFVKKPEVEQKALKEPLIKSRHTEGPVKLANDNKNNKRVTLSSIHRNKLNKIGIQKITEVKPVNLTGTVPTKQGIVPVNQTRPVKYVAKSGEAHNHLLNGKPTNKVSAIAKPNKDFKCDKVKVQESRESLFDRLSKPKTVKSKFAIGSEDFNAKSQLRRSISSLHYKRVNPSKIRKSINRTVSVTEGLDTHHNSDISEEMTAESDIRLTVKSDRKKSVKFLTPLRSMMTPGKFSDTPKQDLRIRLSNWLHKKGVPLDSYHHLQCFGIHHLAPSPNSLPNDVRFIDEENKENEVVSANDSYTEIVNNQRSDFDAWRRASYHMNDTMSSVGDLVNEPAIEVNSPMEEVKSNDILIIGALNDLHKLILEGYEWEQCARWLRAIRERCPSVAEDADYWECRAALEERRGNYPRTFECWQQAIIQGVNTNTVDASLDQLLDKFMQLKLDTDRQNKDKTATAASAAGDRLLDVKNVFKSTLIRFAIKQKKMRDAEPKFVATPVRRSLRLFNTTPSVKRSDNHQQSNVTTTQHSNDITNDHSQHVGATDLYEAPHCDSSHRFDVSDCSIDSAISETTRPDNVSVARPINSSVKRTPLIQICSSLQHVDEDIRKTLVFVPNKALNFDD